MIYKQQKEIIVSFNLFHILFLFLHSYKNKYQSPIPINFTQKNYIDYNIVKRIHSIMFLFIIQQPNMERNFFIFSLMKIFLVHHSSKQNIHICVDEE
jgi:hypothetical protein